MVEINHTFWSLFIRRLEILQFLISENNISLLPRLKPRGALLEQHALLLTRQPNVPQVAASSLLNMPHRGEPDGHIFLVHLVQVFFELTYPARIFRMLLWRHIPLAILEINLAQVGGFQVEVYARAFAKKVVVTDRLAPMLPVFW